MEIKITSLDNIREAAKQFIAAMEDNTVFAFYGKMGAGKTTFIKAICEELGVTDVINSPTFAIVNEYLGGRLDIYHFDMYRVEGWDDLYTTGYFEYLEMGGVLMVEWSENIASALPDDTVKVTIETLSENERRITVED